MGYFFGHTHRYRGTVKFYDAYTTKYTVQYDDTEIVELDPVRGRPTKEKPCSMAFVQDEMTTEEAAQNVLEQTRRVFRFLQDSQRSGGFFFFFFTYMSSPPVLKFSYI